MKPISIVLTINFTFLLVYFLFFAVILDRPELIPLFCGFLALLNLVFTVGFAVDRKKNLTVAFGIGFLLSLGLTLVGFYLIGKFGADIRGDEIRAMLEAISDKFLEFA